MIFISSLCGTTIPFIYSLKWYFYNKKEDKLKRNNQVMNLSKYSSLRLPLRRLLWDTTGRGVCLFNFIHTCTHMHTYIHILHVENIYMIYVCICISMCYVLTCTCKIKLQLLNGKVHTTIWLLECWHFHMNSIQCFKK